VYFTDPKEIRGVVLLSVDVHSGNRPRAQRRSARALRALCRQRFHL
jgi:hypothetical protein